METVSLSRLEGSVEIKGSLQPELALRQRLVLTPQLKQAIRLLQMPLVDLRQEVERLVATNPMVELVEEPEDLSFGEENGASRDPLEPLDLDWGDLYDALPTPSHQEEPVRQPREPEELKAYLLWQLEISTSDERELEAGYILIDALDEGGLLATPIEELKAAFPQIPEELFLRMLHKIQSFDPPGVGARSVQEALEIQLLQLPPSRERKLALDLLTLGLEELRKLNPERLRSRFGCAREDLKRALALLRRLNPRPGNAIGDISPLHVIPDILVLQRGDRFVVEINEEAIPKLRIHPFYAKQVSHTRRREDQPLRMLLQEAKWFLKGLDQRKRTLLGVAELIVTRQREFFLHGASALKPLTLREVAETLQLHESTVSRAIQQKFMATPKGTLPFKFFFSTRIETLHGEVSAVAIKERIRRLIEAEDRRRPLSDAQLAKLLREEGIEIARRTVAKYREALGIPSSTLRKRNL